MCFSYRILLPHSTLSPSSHWLIRVSLIRAFYIDEIIYMCSFWLDTFVYHNVLKVDLCRNISLRSSPFYVWIAFYYKYTKLHLSMCIHFCLWFLDIVGHNAWNSHFHTFIWGSIFHSSEFMTKSEVTEFHAFSTTSHARNCQITC